PSWSRRTVMVTTDRHGHDGPSWPPSSHTSAISYAALFIPPTASMTDRHRHNGPSRVFISKYFNSWNLGTGITSLELHDESAGRTVIATTDRHKLRNPTLGQTSPSSFSSFSTLPPTDRHKHDGPS
ncbi:hypothetical protein EJD97_019748, partial [Solanum chilense]